MIRGTKGSERILVDVALAIPAFCVGVITYWWIDNTFYPASESSAPTTDMYYYHPGEVVEFQSTIHRYKNCKLEIARILERLNDKREFQIQYLSMVIKADNPVFDRPNGFRVQIPFETRPGEYNLFSRIRYFCNGLDYLYPRYRETDKAKIFVKEPRAEKGAL